MRLSHLVGAAFFTPVSFFPHWQRALLFLACGMGTSLTTLPNIGPAMAEMLADVGIHDAETLRDLGTDEAYARCLRNGVRPHFIPFYVIEMALQGRPWNDCKGKEKDALRVRFDAVRARNHDTDRSAFEAIMNAIGVRERP